MYVRASTCAAEFCDHRHTGRVRRLPSFVADTPRGVLKLLTRPRPYRAGKAMSAPGEDAGRGLPSGLQWANVRADKESEKRQTAATEASAKAAGTELVGL